MITYNRRIPITPSPTDTVATCPPHYWLVSYPTTIGGPQTAICQRCGEAQEIVEALTRYGYGPTIRRRTEGAG